MCEVTPTPAAMPHETGAKLSMSSEQSGRRRRSSAFKDSTQDRLQLNTHRASRLADDAEKNKGAARAPSGVALGTN